MFIWAETPRVIHVTLLHKTLVSHVITGLKLCNNIYTTNTFSINKLVGT